MSRLLFIFFGIQLLFGDVLRKHERQLTRQLVSRTNDASREAPRANPLNYKRARYILHAFYLEANMHSEVYSLFEALLDRLSKWIDDNKGFSMNNMHEFMTLCRRAADELEVMRDYRRRAGTGAIKDQPLGLVAVIPAVVATLGIPQRTEIIRQLATIAPGHRDLIAQFAEYVRIFAGKPWKEPQSKNFGSVNEGPLVKTVNRLIDRAGDNKVSCVEKEHVGEVDRIVEGLKAALRAALFVGQCGDSVKTTGRIDSFSKKASTIVVPKVILEASRPLSAVRFEVFQYASVIPESAQHLLQIVTRAVNEKMELEDIAKRVRQATRPEDRLFAPVVMAPLALVSSLKRVSNLAGIVLPEAPQTFRLVTATMFAAIQGGDDYYKLAEQIDHDQWMYPEPSRGGHSATIAANLTAFYAKTDLKTVNPAEPAYANEISNAFRKGFKALAWNKKVPQAKRHLVFNCLAKESKGFSGEHPVDSTAFVVDYWHALSRYTLAARIPFQTTNPKPGPASTDTLSQYRDKLSINDYSLLATWSAIGGFPYLDRVDQILAYETIKTALFCASPECPFPAPGAARPELQIVRDLLAREPSTDKTLLLGSLLQQPAVVSLVQSRLSRPSMYQQSASSFTAIASQLPTTGTQKMYPQADLIEATMRLTMSSSDQDYWKAAAVLLHDCLSKTLRVDIGNHLPAALLMVYIRSPQALRNRMIVAAAMGAPQINLLRLANVRFANHFKFNLFPTTQAVDYVKARLRPGTSLRKALRLVSVQGQSGQSRFVRTLKRAIVDAAMQSNQERISIR